MSMDRCTVCERHIDTDLEGEYCTICSKCVCDGCIRVPEKGEPLDYCLDCYILEGHGEQWEVNYLTRAGDLARITLDTPVNTCSFLIPGFAKSMAGSWWKVANFHKIKEVSIDTKPETS